MVIFHSYVKLPEGTLQKVANICGNIQFGPSTSAIHQLVWISWGPGSAPTIQITNRDEGYTINWQAFKSLV
jgi:hypothetical protein